MSKSVVLKPKVTASGENSSTGLISGIIILILAGIFYFKERIKNVSTKSE